ncbi:hypothetical protein CXG81DRAFT_19145 [Caulochytrium protostelioides]|uniref:Uncharacterized protein n=1 Tax=Caulochytrium protostelioides TaxID=1555241 RepID=A0A4P9X7R6_9FUNG|nr:hypothetical protein CXG81DRAFT_19145 [Caulochytrium protostelioides]|eukprot:RKP01001.1 hypothetical protein CXG81DRAFT_19145 [Caulochytrium protostelioides]
MLQRRLPASPLIKHALWAERTGTALAAPIPAHAARYYPTSAAEPPSPTAAAATPATATATGSLRRGDRARVVGCRPAPAIEPPPRAGSAPTPTPARVSATRDATGAPCAAHDARRAPSAGPRTRCRAAGGRDGRAAAAAAAAVGHETGQMALLQAPERYIGLLLGRALAGCTAERTATLLQAAQRPPTAGIVAALVDGLEGAMAAAAVPRSGGAAASGIGAPQQAVLHRLLLVTLLAVRFPHAMSRGLTAPRLVPRIAEALVACLTAVLAACPAERSRARSPSPSSSPLMAARQHGDGLAAPATQALFRVVLETARDVAGLSPRLAGALRAAGILHGLHAALHADGLGASDAARVMACVVALTPWVPEADLSTWYAPFPADVLREMHTLVEESTWSGMDDEDDEDEITERAENRD